MESGDAVMGQHVLPGGDAPRLRVYVSSTFQDLQECRAQVRLALQRLGVEDVAMETYVAEEVRPLERCLSDVRSCDLYIGVFAWRYGYVPDGRDKSITELEYDEAGAAGLTRLIFMHDERAPWPPVSVDRAAAFDRIEALRHRLAERHVCDFFANAEELRSKVAEAVSREIQRRGSSVTQGPAATGVDEWARYRRRLVDEYRRLDLDALTPPERDEYLAIGLREVFVEPNVREDVPPPELPKELLVKVQGLAEISSEDLPHGIDRQDLERTQRSYRARPAELAFDVVGQPGAGLAVLLGDPGAGKSTLARYVALTLAQEQAEERLSSLRGYQPVLVELRDYSLSRDRYETLTDYLSFRARSDGLGVSGEVLDGHLRAGGKALILLDGLDELFDPREREAVSRQIAGFAAAYPSARVLVTSRVVGYRPRILREAGFRHYTIQDLDPKQIDGFLESWYRLALHDRPAVATGRRERLAKAIRESPSIRELAGNPLLLTILAIIGKHQELPRERWKVYDHAASVLVQHWDVNKHLQDARVDAAVIREDDKKELLRRLAYRMQTGAQGLAGNHLWHDELAAEIEDYLRSRFQYEPGQAAAIANSMIDQFRERNFVLARYGSKIYGFVHRGLLEFFCASEIVARFEKTRALSETALITEVFGGHWEDQAWTEVLRLIAGMVDVSIADRIITDLVTEARPVRSTVLDRPPLDAVTLAAQCLVEIRNISAAAHSAGHTLRALIETLRRPIRSFAEDRDQRLEKAILPAVTAIGARWPGREEYLAWFDGYGGRTGVRPAALFAARFAAALFPDSDRVRDELAERARIHPISDQRRAAVLGLAEVWPDRDATRETVLRVARDPIIQVRLAATEALSEHWATHPSVLAALTTAAHDYSYDVRRSALVALSTHWTAEPITYAAVRDALLDHDNDVREAALRALVARWAGHADTLPAVHRMLRHDPHWNVRQAALEVLVNGWSDEPETLPMVQRAAAEVDEDVREAALDALVARWADHPDTLPTVQRALGDVDEDVRAAAVDLLAARWPEHPDTCGLIESAGRDINGTVRYMALRALVNLSGGSDGVLGVLRRAVEDPEAGVRSDAIVGLAAGWSDAPGVLAVVGRAVRDPNPLVRVKALTAMLEHWPHHEETRRAALTAVRDPHVDARKVALQILARLHIDRPEVRVILDDATRSEDWGVRQIALESLSASQIDGDATRRLLRHVTRDSAGIVRQFALEALIADPQWTDARAEVLEAALRDTHGGTCDTASEATIADRFGLYISHEDLLAAVRSPFWYEREAALFQLVTRDPDDAPAWDEVLRATKDPDDNVRRMAFDLAIMWRADTELGQRIVAAATRDLHSDVRYAAMRAIIVADPDAAQDLGLLQRALVDPNNSIRRLGLETLLLRPVGDATFAMLTQAGADADVTIRLFGQQTLAEHWRDEPRTLAAFRRIARAESPEARRTAITTLATCWPQNPDTLELVQEAIEDPEQTVRRRAIDHLVVCWPQHLGTRERIERAVWDPSPYVGQFARQALAALGCVVLPDTATDACRLTRDCSPPARTSGLEALLIRWPEAPQTREAVRLALHDENWSNQGIARDAICLRWADEDGGTTLDVAAQALGHPQALTRCNGVLILARIGIRRPETLALLVNILGDTVGYVRRTALEVLFAAWPDEPQTWDAALRSVRDLNDDVRLIALQHLVEHRSRDHTANHDARTATVHAVMDPAMEIRRYAVEALGAHWPDDPATRTAYDAASRDPNRSVRALSWSSTHAPQRPLEDFDELLRSAASPEWTERWDAIDQLLVRWPDCSEVRDLALRAVSDPISEIGVMALRAITRRWPDHEGVHQLVLAAARDSGEDIRASAVGSLADGWPDAQTTLDTVLAVCADPSSTVRAAAVSTYARRWLGHASSAADVLRDAVHDPNWWVRYQAIQAAALRRGIPTGDMKSAGCDSTPAVRGFVEAPMAREGSDLAADLPALLAAYYAADRTTAARAAFVLATRWIDREEIMPVLRAEVVGEDHRVRIKALTALVARLGTCTETRDLLERAVVSDCAGVRETALTLLALPIFDGLAAPSNEAAVADDDLIVRWTAREWLALRKSRDLLLEKLFDAPVPTADPLNEQYTAVKELVLRRRDDPDFLDLLKRVAGNACLPDYHRRWLEWLCERLGTVSA